MTLTIPVWALAILVGLYCVTGTLDAVHRWLLRRRTRLLIDHTRLLLDTEEGKRAVLEHVASNPDKLKRALR